MRLKRAWMRWIAAIPVAVCCLDAQGRGESWVPKPPPPPPVEPLTNAARYIEWKWRMDVTDPQTGVNAKTATASVREMAQRLEPTEPWCCVKAKLYAYLCDNLAIGMSEHDWFPAFAVWNRYARPVSPVVGRRNQKIFARYNADEQARMNAGNASGKWTIR